VNAEYQDLEARMTPPSNPTREAGLSPSDLAERAVERTDVRRALARMKPRERALLWLAYAQGASHREIASVLGLKTGSIKLLLFRARRKMANVLRGRS
jgi:RNA polymerase sigma factor (sigma-70 family)